MKILTDFSGANIRVLKEENNRFLIEPDLRDSSSDWFYWAFCAEGEKSESVSFRFEKPNRLGRFGPAVSLDLKSWQWLGSGGELEFSYTFKSSGRVYFAHDILYSAFRFEEFANQAGLAVKTLCISERGRKVPYTEFGSGKNIILLTARHHCCESSGGYVLEGVAAGLKKMLSEDFKVIAVPYVDFDGVCEGDQGKNRSPHDHNRDYDASIYNSVRAIKDLTAEKRVIYAFDFHSPFHMGGRRDYPFIVHANNSANTDSFGAILEETTKDLAIAYSRKNDVAYGAEWNKRREIHEKCSEYFSAREENQLAFTLETPYFGPEGSPTNGEYYHLLGERFAEAILLFDKSKPSAYDMHPKS